MLEFEVRDEYSAVQRADYSLDGDRWQTIYPKDGIADSRVEQFELVLEGEAAARGVILRAADALNNVASARGEAPAAAAPAGQAVAERARRSRLAADRRGCGYRAATASMPSRVALADRTATHRFRRPNTAVVLAITHTMSTATA